MKRRSRKVVVLTASIAGTVSLALAAWLLVGVISGEVSSKTGKATTQAVTATVTLSPSEGLIPEGTPTEGGSNVAEVLSAEIPPSSIEYKVVTAALALTTSNEGSCPKTQFRLEPAEHWEGAISSTGSAGYSRGAGFVWNSSSSLATKREVAIVKLAAAAPTACENVTWKVHVELTHS
jgi:hypothetical protein